MPTYTTVPAIKKSTIPAWEHSPVVIRGDLYRLGFKRRWILANGSAITVERYVADLDCWTKVALIPWDRLLGCAFVDNGRLFVFGVTDTSFSPNKIVRREIDTATWQFIGSEGDVRQSSGGYRLYNTSVCAGPSGYIMAYETNEATPFSLRFLQSADLVTWTPIGALCNANFYSACPTVKYAANGYYLVSYLFDFSGTGVGPWVTAIARTSNFSSLENFGGNAKYTCFQQLMAPDGDMDGINASDVDFVEWGGKTYFTYLTGDQRTWATANDAWFNGSILDLYHEFWP